MVNLVGHKTRLIAHFWIPCEFFHKKFLQVSHTEFSDKKIYQLPFQLFFFFLEIFFFEKKHGGGRAVASHGWNCLSLALLGGTAFPISFWAVLHSLLCASAALLLFWA